jgi:hypothetical protein
VASSPSLTRCPACGRDTGTTEDGRCDFCGHRRPPAVAPEPAEPPEPSDRADVPVEPGATDLWDDLGPQIAATAAALLLAAIGLVVGSATLLVVAAGVLVVAAVAKIVSDGW